ncbi:high-affinity nicotinic acid transporter [Coprinopsis cinerea AmutBmut pab1-1]|nr:high-affinity nicotinic acid transporter [Coprinopsis cinerea AmutBmut pab1-1]
MANFIDRTAIGNARVAGLEKDLRMSGSDFNKAMTVFHVFYALSDIPSNLVLKRYGSIWLAVLVMAFGLVALGSAFMTSYPGFIASRVFLGLAEGGTLSGLVYTLSQYYRRKELAMRVGFFMGVAPSLAGAFGGLLAWGLLRVRDIGVVTRWRKILLVEGLLTTLTGLTLLFVIPAEPSKTKLFTVEERALALARLEADKPISQRRQGEKGGKEKTRLQLVLKAFNVHTTVCTVVFIILNMSFQGLSIFLPTIINNLGHYTPVQVQVRTVPPYLVSAVFALSIAFASFRFQSRFGALFASLLLSVVGYAIAIGCREPHARYGACFLMIAGGGSGGPMIMTWGTENAAPDTMRAVASAAIPAFGAIGAIISVWTYIPEDSPRYLKGNAANLATSILACVLVVFLMLYLRRENRARDSGKRDHLLNGKTEEEINEMGCRHPEFRYQL